VNRRKIIRVGIAGAGMAGYGHLKSLIQVRGAKVVAIADPDESARRRVGDEFGIEKLFRSYEQLLSDESVDLIYVCTPHYLHYRVTMDALQAGKDVICEKPIAVNIKEADEMIRLSKKLDRRLFVAHSGRFEYETRIAKQLLKKQAIGRPFLFLACFIGDEHKRMNDSQSWKGTMAKSGGGVLIDNGIHIIDILCSFFGAVKAVNANCKRLLTDIEGKAEDTSLASLEFKNKIVAQISVTFVARYNNWPVPYVGAGVRIDLYGTKGSLHISNEPENAVTLIQNKGRKNFSQKKPYIDSILEEDKHFINCLINDREPIVKAEEGRKALEVVLACYRSNQEERKIWLK